MTLKELLATEGDIHDAAIVRHGFTDYMRDYVLTAEWWVSGRYDGSIDIRFIACTEVRYESLLGLGWARSMDPAIIDYDTYGQRYDAGEVDLQAFVWGVKFSEPELGPELVQGSPLAEEWSRRTGIEMHEFRWETNHYKLHLIAHDVAINQYHDEHPTFERRG